jgi:hypothetical protein
MPKEEHRDDRRLHFAMGVEQRLLVQRREEAVALLVATVAVDGSKTCLEEASKVAENDGDCLPMAAAGHWGVETTSFSKT